MNPSLLRRSLSCAVAVLIGVAAIACSDVLYGSRHTATVALRPQFSEHDAAIYQSLRTFNLGATTLRVVLVRPAADTLADTTIAIADGQDSIAVVLLVQIAGSSEVLTASLQMLSGSVLIFEGSTPVVAKAGADPTAAAPVLVPVWVGPGAEIARVRIAPRDTTIPASAHLPIAAIAFDANDNIVESAEFQAHSDWTVLEPALGSIPVHGGDFVGAGVRGVARVTLFTPNLLRDTIRITLVPPATQLVTISGDGQTGNGGEVLPQPFVVEVRAADNLPVPNTVVRFSAIAGGGSVATDSTMTNAQGRAQTALTLGSAAGTNTYQALVAGLTPVTISATAVVTRVATTLATVSGGGQTGFTGTTLPQPFVVEVRAADGQPFAGSVVTFSTSGGGSVNPTTATTDAQGRAQTTMTLGSTPGTQSYQASVSGLTPVSVSATATVRQPAAITFGLYSRVVDVGATAGTPATVTASDGTVLDTVKVNYASRAAAKASVSSAGTITGLARGQAIIVASVASNPAIKDSMLAIVAEPGGAVLVSGISKFEYPTSTTVTVSIYVDLRSSPKKLGSTTIDVTWNPAQLTYVNHSSGSSGVSYTPNASNASSGQFTFAMADVDGFGGKVEMLRLKFTTSGGATTGSLALSAREMAASDLSTDLLATLVAVTNPLFVH